MTIAGLSDAAPTLPLAPSPISGEEIERHIRRHVGGRLTELTVVVVPEGIVLSGLADSYHVRQIAVTAARAASGLRLHADRICVAVPTARTAADGSRHAGDDPRVNPQSPTD